MFWGWGEKYVYFFWEGGLCRMAYLKQLVHMALGNP